jgi:hypothetical protein
MEYRFPSAMGEAQSAGHQINDDWLLDVQARIFEIIPVEHKHEVPCLGLLEVILLAVQDCPSGDFILHNRNGKILRER